MNERRPASAKAPATARPPCRTSTAGPVASGATFATASMSVGSARSIGAFDSSATYHLRVGEFAASQTVTRRELLKENTTIERIGTYKNTSPMMRPAREK